MINVSNTYTLPTKRKRYKPNPAKSLSCLICGTDTDLPDAICFDCYCLIQDNDRSDIADRVNRSDFALVDRTIDGIIKKVQEYTGIEDITIKTRKREILNPRQIAQYLAVKNKCGSLAHIGWNIGRKDHATVIHACKTVESLLLDKKFREKYIDLIEYYL